MIVSQEESPQTEINMENVVCQRVPGFASLRGSGKKFAAPGAVYEVKGFSHGLHFAGMRAKPEIKNLLETATLAAMPAPVKSDLPDLPAFSS